MSLQHHLWEHDHPYYATRGCYYSNECHQSFDSWTDFLDEWGEADEDYNLLYRWDWHPPSEDDDRTDHELELFYMRQRMAAPFSVCVTVTEADEPAVREWLAKKWLHMMRLWAPFSEAAP